MTRYLSRIFMVFLAFCLSFGCAALQTDYDAPAVSITSFKAIPGQGLVPQFEIGLHIVNPNRTPLELKGIAYTITLEGHDILTGASNKLPRIDPYGEGDVVVHASVDFFNSIGFFTNLARNQKQEAFSYSLNAKLDVGTLHPVIRISKKGKISLFPAGTKQ